MPWDKPSRTELQNRIGAEFNVLFEGADPRRQRSVEGVLTKVLVLVSEELHGHIAWAARQLHIDTADAEELVQRAAVWGITRNPATVAGGNVTFTGIAASVVPAGAELRRADGAVYRLLADRAIGGGGSGTGAVVAQSPGAIGNSAAGVQLALIEPVVGVNPMATVAAGGLTGGLDQEHVESLRARTIERVQEPPAGGSVRDYVSWVKGVVGETRVWVQPHTPGAGYVTIRFVMPNGAIPSAGTIALVEAAVQERRPVTATGVQVLAPVAQIVPFTISLTPDTLAIRNAVTAALDDLFAREAEPGGTIALSQLSFAISGAPGEVSHVLSVPAAPIVSAPGQIARRGTVTWV